MRLGPVFSLAWRYTVRHPVQSVLLALAVALVAAVPVSLRLVLDSAEKAFLARAASTPQLVGARGSALDLLMTGLYFKQQPLPVIPMRQMEALRGQKLARVIPLYVRFQAQGAPIVGTHLDYFSYRGLALAEGGMMTRLGDCVVGARLARQRGVKAGGSLFSTQEQVFDLAGIYPLKMRVTGVLEASGTADDDAVFVDLKTAWLIEGLAHGHDDLAAGGGDTVLREEKGNVVGNASVRLFNEVTAGNIGSFHFHGDMSGYPLSALLLVPRDEKSEALLAGRFLDKDSPLQLIRPLEEVRKLMETLFKMERLGLVLFGLVSAGLLGAGGLVFALSFRMRRRQFATLADLGVSRRALVLTKLCEVALVAVLGLALAGGLSLAAWLNAEPLVKLLMRG